MNAQEAKTVEQVKEHARKLRLNLDEIVKDYGEITVKNPIGFDFTFEKGKTRELLLRIIDSAKFGYDATNTLFGFLAGCVARRSGFAQSFREIGLGPSMHIQIGNSKGNVHIDSIGIAPARDKNQANLYDFSKITEHWDKDLRPELGPLKHFDVTVIRGQSDLTGTTQWGAIVSIKKRFW
jgi:hypothetical protein